MPHHAAAELAALIHRITDAAEPSPVDVIELRRVIAAGFVSRHPVAVLLAAQDRGIGAAEFLARFAIAKAIAAAPLPPAGGGSLPGSRQRFRQTDQGKGRAHISEIPAGVSRATTATADVMKTALTTAPTRHHRTHRRDAGRLSDGRGDPQTTTRDEGP